MMYGDGWMWGHGWGWGGWVVMSVVMVLFWVALITALVVAIRYLSASNRAPSGPVNNTRPGPENLLAERFARGRLMKTNIAAGCRSCVNTAERQALVLLAGTNKGTLADTLEGRGISGLGP